MATLATALLGPTPDRDYRVAGPESDRARERGLVDGEWFVPPIDPDRLRELSVRPLLRPVLDLALWVALLVGSAVAAVLVQRAVGWLAAAPIFVVYGALYGGACDARWHEFGHGTASSSDRLNEVVYRVASFMALRNPTAWRWSHFRHHSDTIIVGRDPEIQLGRPGAIRRWLLGYTGLLGVVQFGVLLRQARGRVGRQLRDYVPDAEVAGVVRDARITVVAHAAVVGVAVWQESIIPLLLVGLLPSMYGVWLMVFFGVTQHLGLAEDVLDHRASTRTVVTNPVFRFLYLNMNFHVEHHVFPTVPYANLPALHREVAASFPPPTIGMHRAYGEILRSLRAQQDDPGHVVPDRPLPEVASMPLATAAMGSIRPDGAVDLGPVDRFAQSALSRVDVADETFVVVRLADGELCVFDGLCTHGNAHLADGDVIVEGSEERLRCPKHLGQFDARSGEPCRRPVSVALRRHDATLDAGHLIATPSTTSSVPNPSLEARS